METGASTLRAPRANESYPPTMLWRFLTSPPLRGTLNMAVDHALLERARQSNEGVIRIYEWSTPTVSLGRNQKAVGQYDAALARAGGVDVVRRLTGGRAVLHGREITYSVTAPCDSDVGLREQYNAINQALLAGLRALGVRADIVERRKRMPSPGGGAAPCFELPAPGEIAVDGAKLVGSAQVRENGAFLQHGSILVHNDQHLLARASLNALPALPSIATLSTLLKRDVATQEFAASLFAVVSRQWDRSATPLNEEETRHLMDAARKAEATYHSPEWTWRR